MCLILIQTPYDKHKKTLPPWGSSRASKGGLISESFSLWLKSPNLSAKSCPWLLSSYRKDWGILGTHFRVLCKSAKVSDIKPRLVCDKNVSGLLGLLDEKLGHRAFDIPFRPHELSDSWQFFADFLASPFWVKTFLCSFKLSNFRTKVPLILFKEF